MGETNDVISRRRFAGSVASGVALSAASYRRVLGANDRVGVGFIGFGLIGKRHVLDFQAEPDVACVAISDAHRGRLDAGRALIGADCRGVSDFRKLLEDRDVQAVVVSTPDHWHALMTMLACAAGKDVYVEKPLTLFVREGRWMVEVARRHKSVVQVGTQQRSGRHYGRARQLIRGGHIGRVHSVRMYAYRNIMPGFGTPANSNPPPELDWNMFLGPAPARAYNPNRGIYHFRWFWDYSGGQMTNLAHHCAGHHALDARGRIGGRYEQRRPLRPRRQRRNARYSRCLVPVQIAGEWHSGRVGGLDRGMVAPRGEHRLGQHVKHRVLWNQGDAVDQPARVHGVRGQESPAGEPCSAVRRSPSGRRPAARRGDRARRVLDRADRGFLRQRARTVLRARCANFLDCVKSRETPISDLETAHRVSTLCHLANLSLRLDRKLQWNWGTESIIDDREAAALLARPYRPPWDAELRALGVG